MTIALVLQGLNKHNLNVNCELQFAADSEQSTNFGLSLSRTRCQEMEVRSPALSLHHTRQGSEFTCNVQCVRRANMREITRV